ncbi:MAG: DUF2325 domain-containing protein [Anaerovoracaceae bacterium]
MSIAIVGGNDRMARRYKELCKDYKCKAKVFTQPQGIKKQIGCPDLVIFFTSTVSHKMINIATAALPGKKPQIVHCHSSSMAALRDVLKEYAI